MMRWTVIKFYVGDGVKIAQGHKYGGHVGIVKNVLIDDVTQEEKYELQRYPDYFKSDDLEIFAKGANNPIFNKRGC